eukprot:TRINITY_DN2395_c0_g1_i1.p2 TRINITY_DN2395_c0_g1~~TRINITY_DN2395_c0_g1_i1.p2  ORF type:complete len:135 (-),score=71.01 TRINITY_DN2395_c0_g1_i1:1591-1995(-)
MGAGRRKREKREKSIRKARKNMVRYTIDCSRPISDNFGFDAQLFEHFLKERIKVNNKTGNLKDNVIIRLDDSTMEVNAKKPFSKRYLKYLTKKFLKKHSLRDWLRVVANGKEGYELQYFNIQNGDESEEEEDDE